MSSGPTRRCTATTPSTSTGSAASGPTPSLISPGPGRPEDAGISMEVVRSLGGVIPILGVCLGLQCIGQVFGGRSWLPPS